MAKSTKEVLRLTVFRRHILVALLAVSMDPARPLLNSICFRPEDPAAKERGNLRTIASNSHKLVSMIGGTWEGEWPTDRFKRDAVIPSDLFSRKRAKKVLDTSVTVQCFEDGSVHVLDSAAGHQAVGCDPASTGGCFRRYPNVDDVLRRYRHYAVAKTAIGLNATYLEEMGRVGSIFQNHGNNRLAVTLRQRNLTPKERRATWAPVLDASAEAAGRSLDLLVMGLRPA